MVRVVKHLFSLAGNLEDGVDRDDRVLATQRLCTQQDAIDAVQDRVGNVSRLRAVEKLKVLQGTMVRTMGAYRVGRGVRIMVSTTRVM